MDDIKQFELRRKSDNSVLSLIDYCDRLHSVTCYEVTSWAAMDGTIAVDFDFVASVYGKWDGCSHWEFYGQRYDPSVDSVKNSGNSYYHICGAHYVENFMRYMAFIWEVFAREIPDGHYRNEQSFNALRETLLADYEIIEISKGEN